MSKSAWKTDDKEWMKERRAKWKKVQVRLKDMFFIKKDFKAAIKEYFMTGAEGEGHGSMKKLDVAPLIELWLHPDDSPENWARIKKKYDSSLWGMSRYRFLDTVRSLGDDHLSGSTESFFDGRDERLYDLFAKRRLKREDYLDLGDDEFHKKAWGSFRLAANIVHALLDDVFNPYNSLSYRLEEWHDAIELAYDPERVEFDWVVQLVDRVHRDPDQFTPEQVDLAKRVAAILSDPTLPEQVKADIDAFRQRPCHPDCTNFEED